MERARASAQGQAAGAGDRTFDIAIIGGGVNGCGIARDAAGRGYSVYLCEQGDLAIATSSASTKLLHGGLRYLEYYEFKLVREALTEREVVWGIAPHIVHPLRFVLPYGRGMRPWWMLRLGLFLYDHLGGRKLLPKTRALDLGHDVAGAPLKSELRTRGFEYSDCWVDDARLVVLNAADARAKGAVIETRTRAVAFDRAPDAWTLTVEDREAGTRKPVRARVLVNAAGPWADRQIGAARPPLKGKLRLVQGSHIVVPRLFDHDRCYIFQNPDGRIVFAIPYEGDFTLIGTTDLDYQGDPAKPAITPEETAYLCSAASEYFARPVTPADVVWTYSGVRALYDDGASAAQAATRDYVLELNEEAAPLLSVLGGKITTYRHLALDALDKLVPHLGPAAARRGDWTGTKPLPGGDFPPGETPALARALQHGREWLADADAARLARTYGTQAHQILEAADGAPEARRSFGAGLTVAEVRHLMGAEFARTADDVIWRRTKLGLRLSTEEVAALDAFMAQERRSAAA
ncbi:glycerol-3-phosphate dehydrogenase [Aquabacter sp. L1I39]|uniref:glycerol-3-phosphate dehydrogenase n=1 Tax=Aquabacter sp. L1I39 TaxID=2820278 RepID=UPI001AD95489|nr:glycerol-3-phosphate dehydrogenase [Aquabacter sp. L1I39]QTL03758.1 glycerol-3-phosphate dehydrogenase [Aquabacter sp. L1I39]